MISICGGREKAVVNFSLHGIPFGSLDLEII